MTVVEDVVQPTAEDLEEYEQYKCKSIPLDCHMGLNVLNREPLILLAILF